MTIGRRVKTASGKTILKTLRIVLLQYTRERERMRKRRVRGLESDMGTVKTGKILQI